MKFARFMMVAVALVGLTAFADSASERLAKLQMQIAMKQAQLESLTIDGTRARLSPSDFINDLYLFYFPHMKEEAYKMTVEEKMLAIKRMLLQKDIAKLEFREKNLKAAIERKDASVLNEPGKAPVVPWRVQPNGSAVQSSSTVAKGKPPKCPSILRKEEARKQKAMEIRKKAAERKAGAQKK